MVKTFGRNLVVSFFFFFCTFGSQSYAASFWLDFEGLSDLEQIQNFYNGGLGGNGSGPGTNFGVSFSNNAFALIDSDSGGSGDFGGEPSPDTAMYVSEGISVTANVPGGFDTALSFFYTAAILTQQGTPVPPGLLQVTRVSVFDGLDGTGVALGSINQLNTLFEGAPDPGSSSPFESGNVVFAGTAHSVLFEAAILAQGTPFISLGSYFDNITFGSADPGIGMFVSPIPLPPALLLFGTALIGFIGVSRRRNVA